MFTLHELTYIDSAIAMDGGSVSIHLSNNNEDIHLLLDRKIGSQTRDKLYMNEKVVPVSEEKDIARKLEQLISTHSEPDDMVLVNVVMDVIRERHS